MQFDANHTVKETRIFLFAAGVVILTCYLCWRRRSIHDIAVTLRTTRSG